MKRSLPVLAIIAGSFLSGFAFKSMLTNRKDRLEKVPRITGIGGIFFKSRDPKLLAAWYHENLGLEASPYGGAIFDWFEEPDSNHRGQTVWQPFPEKTTYFQPSEKDFMVNYRVQNLDALLGVLRKNGVRLLDTVQKVEYGRFVHILDLEGNKVELWEPNGGN